MVNNFCVSGGAAMTSNDSTWTTPKDKFDQWNSEFNFVLDAAALSTSALCDKWYGPDHVDEQYRDALDRDWLKDSGGGYYLAQPSLWSGYWQMDGKSS